MRCPKPMIRLPVASASSTHRSGSPSACTSSSIGFTYAGAPPWSGPESAPTAAESAAPQSAPVEATMRAVNVDAFSPCSAVQIQYVSIAFTWRGSASPRQRKRNFSAAVSPRATTSSGTGCLCPSAIRAERATIDIICAESRPRSSRACSSEISLSLPRRQWPASRAVSACRSAGAWPVSAAGSYGSGSGIFESRSSSTSSPQTFSYGYRPTSSSMSMPRYRSDPPSRSGSAISVSTATTPSRPGLKSSDIAWNLSGPIGTGVSASSFRSSFPAGPDGSGLGAKAWVGSRPVAHEVTLIPGDGTGPELTEATRRVLEATGVEFDWDVREAGADVMERHGGNPLPPDVLAAIRDAGVALKGPITTPVGGGFRSVNVALRKELDLYAQVRPCKTYRGVRTRLEDVDLVVVRENTEDLYAGIEYEEGAPETRELIE